MENTIPTAAVPRAWPPGPQARPCARRRGNLLAASAVLVLGMGLTAPASRAQIVPFDSERWEIAAQEARVEEHLGQKSLFLRGGIAWIKDADLTNGMIEFDIAFSEVRGFMGGVWRMQDTENYEEFYMRPHQSGNPDANQYTPAFHGVTGWQLYHGKGYGAPVTYAFDQWMHVKIVFSGSQGEVTIDSEEPVLFIRELKREVGPGKVGVRAGNYAPAHFANFRYRSMESPILRGKPQPPEPAPAGMIRTWSVSQAFDERSVDHPFLLSEKSKKGLKWTTLPAERKGVTNLARIQGTAEGANTVFAKVRILSERPQIRRVRFGFSDRVKVYFNDRLIYGGNNGYRSRDYRYLGTIGLFDELYLPLDQGVNELWFAVSEDFGGWGIQAVIEDMDGIRLEN